jgi:polysaccharide export outer membrane protein
VPKELKKVTQPTYVVEPPDILLIDAVRLVPLPPYRIEPLDVLIIFEPNALPTEPIAGPFLVEPDGTVNLGLQYGSVRVVGMTLVEAQEAVRKHLSLTLKDSKASVALGQSRGLQQIRGDHLVRPDGTINLGTYGDVRVAGLALPEAKTVIETHLAQFLQDPMITLDVSGYNSKVYYVIADGGGAGEQVTRFPITGNDTVLDAISQIGGLPFQASKKRIWIARPAPGDAGCQCCQTLTVNWKQIVQCGDTRTNYQLMPGDRLYVHSSPLVALDVAIGRVAAPLERLFGVTTLGVGTFQTIKGAQGSGQSGNVFGGGFFNPVGF